MNSLRKWAGAFASLVAASGVVVAAAPAAQAVTDVLVLCETGGGQFLCQVSHDGTAPLTIRWTINGAAAPGQDDRTWIGLFPCGRPVPSVTATVTDAGGAVSDGATFVCNYGPWP